MLRKLINFFRPKSLETDMLEELEYHRSRTTGSLGNLGLLQDRMRDASTISWLETTWQDLRYGIRQLGKAPVLLTVAVLSLALGIGANTAIFTLIDAVMRQYLPVRDPARLVLFNDDIATGVYDGDDSFPNDTFSYPSWRYLLANNDSFEDLCAFRQGTDTVVMHVAGTSDNGPRERAEVHLVSGNYFGVLGVTAAAGRLLGLGDDSPSAPPVAVISYPFWRDRFHLDRSIVGQAVVLNDAVFTIVGVAASEFFGERVQTGPDYWLPLSFQPRIVKNESWLSARNVFWLNMIGRLRPGMSLAGAQERVRLRLQQSYLEQAGSHPTATVRRKIQNVRVQLTPGGGGISGIRSLYSEPLKILMAVVAVVLLIACANIATLLLARASARRQEFLARLALGASRSRLLRQVLTESLLLSIFGGIAGALFAWWCVRMLVVLLHLNAVVKVEPDPAVLTFTIALSFVTGILFGIIPAIKFSRIEPRPTNVARTAALGGLRFSGQQALITLQVALSLVLLVGAGLLVHSLLAMERQNVGFRRDHILLVRTDAGLGGYQQSELPTLYRQLEECFNRLPGILSAAIVRFTPESGTTWSSNFSIQGHMPPGAKNLTVYQVPVGARFFETLDIPLLLGRTLGERDAPGSTPVAVVNQTFVREYFPHQNPIGQRISLGAPFKAPGVEIVGVVGDSKYYDLRENPHPMAFFSVYQEPATGFQVVLHTSGAPNGMAAEVRRAFQQVSSKLPVFDVMSLDVQVEKTLNQQKMITTLCSIFGALALVLASIGIYGTLAYSVAGRVREIGIRMAIGAQRSTVIWLVLRDSALLVLAGIAVGLPLAWSGTRWIESFLYGVQTLDPLAIVAAVILILMLASVAGYLPARRAAKIDPMRALRHE